MSDQNGRYSAFTKRLVDRVLTTPGHTSSELRGAVAVRAARLSGGTGAWTRRAAQEVPGDLAGYLDTVARHAYKVTDADLAVLQRAGHSDDALFEVTVAAALGAALGRLERGLAALRGEDD